MTPSAPLPEGQTVTTPSTGGQIIAWAVPARAAAFNLWLSSVQAEHGLDAASLRLASADASFRRYFRVDSASGSRIVMDAPPDKEDCAAFDRVGRLMAGAGLNVPEVLAWDRTSGFMLLSDLGARTMMAEVEAENSPDRLPLYMQAVDILVSWQIASKPGVLPPYDETLLLRELELFPQWYMERHRGLVISAEQRAVLDATFRTIVQENLAWPSVYVHRDFMPRNLMLPSGGEPRMGVLDFQDAVYGPVTYDIASLMRDAFLSWDEAFVLDVTIRYWEKARAAGLPVGSDFGAFYRGVEWMGLQRHLKVAGIFARITLRDGKPRYLADTPRFIQYIRATAGRYRELKPLLRLLDTIEGVTEVSGYAFGRV